MKPDEKCVLCQMVKPVFQMVKECMPTCRECYEKHYTKSGRLDLIAWSHAFSGTPIEGGSNW
jgi:hypothetical protein